MRATMSLSTAGVAAMSSDERWLILLSRKDSGWVRLKNWLTENTGWSPSFLPDDFRYRVLVIDLQSDRITTCDPSTKYDPEIMIHPDNTGFVVADVKRNYIVGTPVSTSKETILSWYALPPVPGHRSRNEWLLILCTFLTPILLAMFLHLLRRTRPASFSSASK